MKMTQRQMQVAKAYIQSRIDRENYGMLRNTEPHGISLRDEMEFKEAGWSLDWNHSAILLNGEPMYRIRKKYSTKKVNGSYKSLLPKIEYIGG